LLHFVGVFVQVTSRPLVMVSPPGGLGLDVDVCGRGRPVGLAESVAAGDQRDGLLVVHRHAPERVADVLRGGNRIRFAIRAFRVHVDQAHLNRGERIREVPGVGLLAVIVGDEHAVAFDHAGRALRVADVAAQPRGLAAPVHVEIRLPDVRAAAAEAERLEAHRLQSHVAREDHEIGPGDLPPVLLLDRPEQSARLVEADVVRPAVERREALLTAAAAAAPVADAVRAGAVPGHSDEEPAIVAEVRRPPVLGIGHQRREVLLQGRVVQAPEFPGVVEFFAHRVRPGRVLVQDVETQLVRPPVPIRPTAACVRYRTLALRHRLFPPVPRIVRSTGESLLSKGLSPVPAVPADPDEFQHPIFDLVSPRA
jgi:hypothetical protein